MSQYIRKRILPRISGLQVVERIVPAKSISDHPPCISGEWIWGIIPIAGRRLQVFYMIKKQPDVWTLWMNFQLKHINIFMYGMCSCVFVISHSNRYSCAFPSSNSLSFIGWLEKLDQ